MKRPTGFTLIELMVTIAVVAILAAFAIPTFSEQLAKGRRSDAIATLTDLQLKQERWRANHSTYGSLKDVTGAADDAAFNAAHEHYDYSVSDISATDVLITATPKGGHAGDRCGNFMLRIDNDNNSAPAGMVDKSTSTNAARCW